jgi:hypothetical protein
VASNQKRIATRAPDDAWRRLGELLEERRRIGLGYQFRPAFAKERGINIRRVQDIENSYRPNTFPAGSLREIARAYDVSYESVTAVLRGEADKLSPAEPVLAPVPAAPGSDSRRTAPADGEDKIVTVIPLPAGTAGPTQLPAPFTVELGDGQVTLTGDTLMTGAQAHVIIAALRKAFGEPPGQPGPDGASAPAP